MAKSRAKSFSAVLERDGTRLNWVMIRIPLNVAEIWGTRGMLRVKGQINGFAFRTSLFPTGRGSHIMIVNKRMQAGGRVKPGALAQFQLQPDTQERVITVPGELKRILDADKSFRRWYDHLGYSIRKEVSQWVGQVKSAQARVRRAEQISERLLATMEAERDLPPILQLAFARHPAAGEGWERMSVSRRRGHLLGIFYYRSPEARARRVAKALDDAARLARKGKRQA
jgi:uncharacterized protein YdeI (YjbR/CyaY-like superfamily)